MIQSWASGVRLPQAAASWLYHPEVIMTLSKFLIVLCLGFLFFYNRDNNSTSLTGGPEWFQRGGSMHLGHTPTFVGVSVGEIAQRSVVGEGVGWVWYQRGARM